MFKPYDLYRIYAFLRRDIVNRMSYKLNFTFDIISDFIFVLTFGILGYATQPAQAPYMEEYGGMTAATFIIIAMICQQFMQTSQFAPQYIANPGAMERIILTPCPIPVFILGSMSWRYFRGMITLAISIPIGLLMFGMTLPRDILSLIIVMAVGTTAMLGLGIIASAIQLVTKQWNPINWFIGNFSWLVSGTLYSRQFLLEVDPTGVLYAIGWFLPHTYVYDMVRKAWVGISIIEMMDYFMALLAVAAILFTIGWLTFRACLRYCQIEGSLGWV